MIIEGVKSVGQTASEPISGSFSIIVDPMQWTKCREQFANYWKPEMDAFWFSHDSVPDMPKAVAAFIARCEAILELGEESQFSLTNRPHVLWVSPAQFWRGCHVRRSLYTVLLRCGRKYNIAVDNFEQALYSEAYASDTKRAIMRFLFGFTQFNGDAFQRLTGMSPSVNTGWWTMFKNRNDEHLRNILVVDSAKRLHSPIGAGRLWT